LGTPDYLAPELLLGTGHGMEVDWWSLGVILFEAVVGIPPFSAASPEDIFQNILERSIPWPPGGSLSPELVDLLDRLLSLDPALRLGHRGAQEIKLHPWFAGVDWADLARQKAAFVPTPSDETDTSYFLSSKEVSQLSFVMDLESARSMQSTADGHAGSALASPSSLPSQRNIAAPRPRPPNRRSLHHDLCISVSGEDGARSDDQTRSGLADSPTTRTVAAAAAVLLQQQATQKPEGGSPEGESCSYTSGGEEDGTARRKSDNTTEQYNKGVDRNTNVGAERSSSAIESEEAWSCAVSEGGFSHDHVWADFERPYKNVEALRSLSAASSPQRLPSRSLHRSIDQSIDDG
jgi:serine/threonine protein kinase